MASLDFSASDEEMLRSFAARQERRLQDAESGLGSRPLTEVDRTVWGGFKAKLNPPNALLVTMTSGGSRCALDPPYES